MIMLVKDYDNVGDYDNVEGVAKQSLISGKTSPVDGCLALLL